jgi:hypothetical protein
VHRFQADDVTPREQPDIRPVEALLVFETVAEAKEAQKYLGMKTEPQSEDFRFCSWHKRFHHAKQFKLEERTCALRGPSQRKKTGAGASSLAWAVLQPSSFVSAAQPAITIQYPPGLPLEPLDVTMAVTFSGREAVLLPQKTYGTPQLLPVSSH